MMLLFGIATKYTINAGNHRKFQRYLMKTKKSSINSNILVFGSKVIKRLFIVAQCPASMHHLLMTTLHVSQYISCGTPRCIAHDLYPARVATVCFFGYLAFSVGR